MRQTLANERQEMKPARGFPETASRRDGGLAAFPSEDVVSSITHPLRLASLFPFWLHFPFCLIVVTQDFIHQLKVSKCVRFLQRNRPSRCVHIYEGLYSKGSYNQGLDSPVMAVCRLESQGKQWLLSPRRWSLRTRGAMQP